MVVSNEIKGVKNMTLDEIVKPSKKTKDMKHALMALEDAQLMLERKQQEFAQYLTEVRKQEENVKNLKEKLYETMEANEVKELETDYFKVTATWSYPRHTYDMKKLAALYPELHKQVDDLVGGDTQVKGSVRIKIK